MLIIHHASPAAVEALYPVFATAAEYKGELVWYMPAWLTVMRLCAEKRTAAANTAPKSTKPGLNLVP